MIIKRSIDLTISFLGLFILSLPMLVIAVLIAVLNGRPVLFSQKRVGHKGKIFSLYKFRTMRDPRPGEDLHSMNRLTPLGKFLRSLSLDELPGLFNVIKGEMSLVGPRPLLVHYLERYNKRQMRRHDVLPGVTGHAQVNGRNALSWEDKFNYDIWYVENHSPWVDFKIMLKTFFILFNRKTVNSSQVETMEEFDPGLYVMGAGGHGKVVVATLHEMGERVMGVFDDDLSKKGSSISGVPVLGSFGDMKNYNIKKAVMGIGSNEVRERLADQYDFNWMTVIHPESYVHASAKIGKGSVIFAKAVVQPDVIIGEHVIINSASVVDHDCSVASFSHLCPGSKLAGNVTIGRGVMLGTGANVIPGRNINEYSLVGSGSTVISDIEAYSVAVGSPARIVKSTKQLPQRKKA